MNYKILGIILASVLFIGIATAAIVAYVSNEAILSFGVTQGVVTQNWDVAGNAWSTAPVVLADVTAGSTYPFFTRVDNNANNALNKPLTFVITNSNGDATCADFGAGIPVEICNTADDCSTGTGIGSMSNCAESPAGTLTFSFTISQAANEAKAYKMSPTFDFAVSPATYTFQNTVMA